MAIPCSCHFIDTAYVQAYLRQNGPVLTAKLAKAARARLHAQRREERREDGLADKTLCGICADHLLKNILSESCKMYPRQHAEHLEAEKLPEAA